MIVIDVRPSCGSAWLREVDPRDGVGEGARAFADSKDEIKQALMDVLGLPQTVPESQRLGRAAVMAMLVVAHTSPGAVLDSTFYPYTVPSLQQLRPPLIEIRCRCPREIADTRYRRRSQNRHAGHLDGQRTPNELWNDSHLIPLGLGPLIEVDTGPPVDAAAVAARVRRAAAAGP
jgi:hypothetical protein